MQLNPGGLAAEPSPVATELYYTPSPVGTGCRLPPKEGMSLVLPLRAWSCAPGPPVLLGSDHCLHPDPILKGPRSQSLSLLVKLIQLEWGREPWIRTAQGSGRWRRKRQYDPTPKGP